jgi:hypothetical protein
MTIDTRCGDDSSIFDPGTTPTGRASRIAATYQEWIADYVKRSPVVLGKCREAVARMRRAFPELAEVRGHVYCVWGKRGHFWAVAPDGAIVDPTRAQFPGPITYEPWESGDAVRVGKCMNCGEEIWAEVSDLRSVPHREFCGEVCEAAMARFLSY